jgi:mRNA-degrading endonuclease YafQ of YafQ-DinJ toxin-antitoxin module
MWRIYEGLKAQKVLGKLPKDLLKRYEKWKDIVMISGPQGLRMIKGFHDEKLKGLWQGYRSSRLNLQYRVIYRIQSEQVYVEVFDISAHRY